MSGPDRLIATAWQWAWALLVCAVLFSFLRAGVGGRPVAVGGHPDGSLHPWFGAAAVRLCEMLFVLGLVLRAKRWFSARSAESARRRRLEAARILVGSPERFGARGSTGRGRHGSGAGR